MLCALCFVVGYMIFRAQTLSKLSRLVKKKNYGHLGPVQTPLHSCAEPN